MDSITYNTTFKASGKEYKKIVFWNRFLRNPAELLLTLLPAAISIVLICLGKFNTYYALFYTASFCYPLYIFCIQFKSNVNYHLKHRDPAESAPCTISMTCNAITASIPEYEQVHTYEWSDFTNVYFKFGYFIFFTGSKATLMLKLEDMSTEQPSSVKDFIKNNLDMNKCRVTF